MGLLIEGLWHDRWYETAETGGRFRRDAPSFAIWRASILSLDRSPLRS